VRCSKISMDESKSSLLIVDIYLLAFEGIRIIVFSIPGLAILSPESFKRSFSAV
jgi:hypothetical protein